MDNYQPTLDAVFQALSDPTRRAVVQRLGAGPATVSELAQPFDMALPSFLGHLKKLEHAGLVRTAKKGRVRRCTLRPNALTPMKDWLDEQRMLWDERLNMFDDYVTKLAKGRGDGS